MNDKNKKHIKKNLIVFGIACIIISTIFTFNVTTSRYIGEITATDDIIAKPILTLSNNSQTFSVSDMLPGDVETFDFSVSNVNGEEFNEILLTYYFKINITTITETAVPLQAEIYEVTAEKETLVASTNNVTQELQMPVAESVSNPTIKNYRLKILWDEADNSYTYAGQTMNCSITLEAIQTN